MGNGWWDDGRDSPRRHEVEAGFRTHHKGIKVRQRQGLTTKARRHKEDEERRTRREIRTVIESHSVEGRDRADFLSHEILGAAIEVHRVLGPGLLESAYEECLCHELSIRGIPFQRQFELPVEYKGLLLDCGYRIDLLVDGLVIVELKSIEKMSALHEAQLLTYLRIKRVWLGMLINFNVPVLRDGVKRLIN
jgi:GxxExxY protein